MLKAANPRPLGTDDVLYQQGDPPVGVYVLLEGTLVPAGMATRLAGSSR